MDLRPRAQPDPVLREAHGYFHVRGTFGQFTGSIEDDNGVVKHVTVDIDVASLDTGNGQRDDHLRSPDFFDVAAFPKATFVLTAFDRNGDDVTATGDLTIRGITKPVTLKVKWAVPPIRKQPEVSAELETKISRKEWGSCGTSRWRRWCARQRRGEAPHRRRRRRRLIAGCVQQPSHSCPLRPIMTRPRRITDGLRAATCSRPRF